MLRNVVFWLWDIHLFTPSHISQLFWWFYADQNVRYRQKRNIFSSKMTLVCCIKVILLLFGESGGILATFSPVYWWQPDLEQSTNLWRSRALTLRVCPPRVSELQVSPCRSSLASQRWCKSWSRTENTARKRLPRKGNLFLAVFSGKAISLSQAEREKLPRSACRQDETEWRISEMYKNMECLQKMLTKQSNATIAVRGIINTGTIKLTKLMEEDEFESCLTTF